MKNRKKKYNNSNKTELKIFSNVREQSYSHTWKSFCNFL